MSYQLQDGVFLVQGIKRGAIFDTNSEKVYSINGAAVEILAYQALDESYWNELILMGLAKLSSSPKIAEPPKFTGRTDSLRFVWFEITDRCNLRCVHCYADCNKKRSPKPKMTHQDWLKIITGVYALGCRGCQFIGGEPFLYKGQNGETVLDLAEHAVSIGYTDVELFTNATLLTKTEVQRIKDLELNIAVSLYSNGAQIHDKITGRLGSFEKSIRALALLKGADVPTRVEIVIMKSNQHTVELTTQLVSELGFNHKQPDIIRPSGRGINADLEPDPEILARYGLMFEPNFSVNFETFTLFCNTNSCLFGKIAINNNGDVYPCIFSGNYLFGNFVETKVLQSIIKGRAAQTVWLNTKDDIQVCRDCEYRYVCEDCRPLAAACAGGGADFLNAPPPRCTYNPYTGEWGRGTWKLNRATRQPYYDRSLEPVIRKFLTG